MIDDNLFSPLLSIFLLALVTKYLALPLWFSPLSRIPAAHPLCHITDAWIVWKRWVADENEPILKAHRKKGRLIRLSPTEVSINQIEGGVKIVAGTFDRSDWWRVLFTRAGELPLSAWTLKSEHGAHKKILAGLYPNSQLCASTDFQACLQTMSRDVLSCINLYVQGSKPINILMLSIAASVDVLVSHCYGVQNRPKFLMDFDKTEEFYINAMIEEQGKFCQAELPNLYRFLGMFGTRSWSTRVNNAQSYMNEFGKQLTERVMKENAGTDCGVHDQERSKAVLYEGVQEHFGERNLAGRTYVELLDQVGAGSIQSALRDELLALGNKFGNTADYTQLSSDLLKELDRFPLLEACITETIRVYPPLPRQLPRKSPPEGFHFEGYYVPRDTTVSISSFNLHREESVFADCAKWDPYRWLEKDPQKLRTMRSWLWGFGSGPFGCPGLHVGRHVMNVFLSLIYQNFVSELAIEGEWKPYLNGIAFPTNPDIPTKFTPFHGRQKRTWTRS